MAYIRETFMPKTLDDAKHIALSGDPHDPHKFQEETDYLISLLREHALVHEHARVLDFGCGMGRVAKALIKVFGVRVTGVDTSSEMRYFAHQYVADPRFLVLPEPRGIYEVALAVFVLQHVEYPEKEVIRIRDHMTDDGVLLVVNEKRRFVPAAVDEFGYVIWEHDGVDIEELLNRYFMRVEAYSYYRGKDISCTLWRKSQCMGPLGESLVEMADVRV